MTANAVFQILFYLIIVLLLVKPLGGYIARVYSNQSCGINFIVSPIERFIYRLCSIDPNQEMDWKKYLSSMLFFNLVSFLIVYALQRFQSLLPLNPQHFTAISPITAFNTAASFITNTDWQTYSGEKTLSYLSQMLGLTTQNFLSAATNMALLVALIRGLIRFETVNLGNFWVDIVRGTLYILLPLSLILAIALASFGVIQNFKPYQHIHVLQESTQHSTVIDSAEQIIPMGPVASQIAIKQLGSNGGGFFNTNSAHPLENPTPCSNFLEMLAILLIPAALCYTFGTMIRDKKQGWALLTAMLLILIPAIFIATYAEQAGNPLFNSLNIDQTAKQYFAGGNMEGKETRFGITNSALWTTVATATANGSVNSMLDSYTPIGGMVPLWLMHLGEIIFGGVGSGLYGMLMIVIITVFVAGLMVGRSPEYLGKKIELFEMKMASIAVLLMPLIALFLTAVSVVTTMGTSSISNPGAHGFTQILYAFTSMANNNGSAFSGLNASTPFYSIVGGIEMLALRFWIAIPTLAIAGALVQKKKIPINTGTLPTHTPLFIFLLIGVALVLGALTFFPALALGPIVENLTLWGQHGH